MVKSLIFLKNFFNFWLSKKAALSDDLRTWRSRENWREEQIPIGEGDGEKADRGWGLGVSEAPCACPLWVPASWGLGQRELSAGSQNERSWRAGTKSTPELENVQPVGLENVLAAKQSFPGGCQSFRTCLRGQREVTRRGSSRPDQPRAVEFCLPVLISS